ncbi:RNA polymerase sigma factor SigZ [Pseudoalteromonas distincta]|uniref:RNA polymerase sigma factor SigZ n=1 Tax=Pseudoalteromonas distincta TaxID=77608 RepID=UPI0039E8078F
MYAEWEEHRIQLKNYISRKVDDQSIVEDILQDVYIKASANLHNLNAKGSIKSWLYTITRNTIMDYYRKRVIYEELPDNIIEEQVESAEANYKAIANCIEPLIQELPEKYRIALVLSELEELSQQHIADKLGLTLSAAKSRIQRGRHKLREIMLTCCDFEISNGGITDFTPRNESAQKYYESIRKRFS